MNAATNPGENPNDDVDEERAERMNELLAELEERLADDWFEYRIRAWDVSPSGTLRAPIDVLDSDGDTIEKSVRIGSGKTTAINALPEGLEVETLSEGYNHFEVRLADDGGSA